MIARVVVDTPLPHLDRLFDYTVPDGMNVAQGCRVKVRFAGRMIDGLIAELVEQSDFGKLAPIAKVVSVEPVLRADVLSLARAVADRYAGTLSDVLRLAIPKRHARAEAANHRPPSGQLPQTAHGWEPSRVAWSVLPGDDPAESIARSALAALHAGKGSVVVVPDLRDVARWSEVFTRVLGAGRHAVLTAGESPEKRYRAFLALARGEVRIALGTRAAAFAPVHEVGFVALWDDGDDLLGEPRAPYPHAREVLLLRAAAAGAALVLAGHARTAEVQSLVRSGWCRSVEPPPEGRRAAWPRVDVVDGSQLGRAPVRLPSPVIAAIRAADGPVLVQVPRRGYRSALACLDCRQPARCATCQGPLAQTSATAVASCQWCAVPASQWQCPHCGGTRLRAPVIGHLRTAEEFTRTFPDRPVVASGGDRVIEMVAGDRVLVLATPGAEPRAPQGYALVVLLDTWLMQARADIRVIEESHRRWFNALALAAADGRALAVGEATALQALVRADPVSVADRELDDRAAAHLPPAARLVVMDGPEAVLDEVALRGWTRHTEVLGPVPHGDVARLIVRAPKAEGAELASLVHEVCAQRSAAKAPPIRARMDPVAL